MSDLLSNVERLLERADNFDNLTPGQQAGFRSQLTKLLKQGIADAEILTILQEIQEQVGTGEVKAKARKTVEDYEQEFPEFKPKGKQQRAAYKAGVKRLLNEARKKGGDAELVQRLADLEAKIVNLENQEIMGRIRKLAKRRKA